MCDRSFASWTRWPPASERADADSSAPLSRGDVARLSAEPARRLASVAAVRAAPPQAPITVAVTSTVSAVAMLTARFLSPRMRRTKDALTRFADRAVNEESLAGEYSLFLAHD
jgi:hypothetical protein